MELTEMCSDPYDLISSLLEKDNIIRAHCFKNKKSMGLCIFAAKDFRSHNKALADCVWKIGIDCCVTSTLSSMNNQPQSVLFAHNV